MNSGKQKVLLFGNCQGEWFAKILKLQPRVTERFEVIYLANFGERAADHPINNPDFLSSCAVVLWQTAFGCKPPDFLVKLPADCRQIRYPTLSLKFLWPFHAGDPRNAPENGFPFGRYAYGDRLLMQLMDGGMPPGDLFRRYVETDIGKIVDLDRLKEMSFSEIVCNDRQSDIAIAQFLETSFRDRRLFHTINHPAFAALSHLYRLIESGLLEKSVRDEILWPPHVTDDLSETQIPVHPQVASHYKLSWIQPAEKWRYQSEFLTLEEYVRAYGEFRPIPMGDPPQVCIDRAREAAREKNLAEAKRILLGATIFFQTSAQFLECLATLLIDAKELVEAEQVLRYAISRFPHVASLHNELGVLMQRRNFTDEAVRLFNEALRLDPRSKRAGHNLLHSEFSNS